MTSRAIEDWERFLSKSQIPYNFKRGGENNDFPRLEGNVIVISLNSLETQENQSSIKRPQAGTVLRYSLIMYQ